MFAIPNHGWTNVCIGDFEDRASYLTDIPMESLKLMILSITEKIDFVIDFDAEGWTFKVISDEFSTYIIQNKDESKLYVNSKNKYELGKEIYYDINNNFEEWSNWNPFLDEEEFEEQKIYKAELLELLIKLKELLEEKCNR